MYSFKLNHFIVGTILFSESTHDTSTFKFQKFEHLNKRIRITIKRRKCILKQNQSAQYTYCIRMVTNAQINYSNFPEFPDNSLSRQSHQTSSSHFIS